MRWYNHLVKQEKIGVCVLVFNKEKEILLGERLNSYKAGHFGIPGGRLELNESLLGCAKREIMEETGLVIDALEYVGVVRELQEDSNFIHFAFVAKDVEEQPQNKEPHKCKGWDWYPFDKLPHDIMPGHLAALTMFEKGTTLTDINKS